VELLISVREPGDVQASPRGSKSGSILEQHCSGHLKHELWVPITVRMAVPVSRRFLRFVFGLGLFTFSGASSLALTRVLWQYDIFKETVSWGDFATELAEVGIKLIATLTLWLVSLVATSALFHRFVAQDEAKFIREHERRLAQELLTSTAAKKHRRPSRLGLADGLRTHTR